MNSLISVILNSVWQAAGIAAFAWVIVRFSPKMNAATRHAVWWAVLGAVVVLPAVQPLMRPSRLVNTTSIAIPTPKPATSSGSATPAAVPPLVPRSSAPIQLDSDVWRDLLPALWFVALAFQLFRIVRSYWYVRRLKHGAVHAGPEVQRAFENWLRQCRIRRPVRLLVSKDIASPLAAGFLHPAVILPEPLMTQFREDELDHVLLHELAHLARRDDWTNLMARLAAAPVMLHPVAAWTLRRIDRERELACDDWVVAQIGAARPYAASLARLFEICLARRRVLLATGMADRASHLGERIEELLRRREFVAKASVAKVGASTLALAGLALIAAGTPPWIVLARPPQPAPAPRAERPPKAAPAPRTITPAPSSKSAQVVVEARTPPRGGLLASLVAAGYDDLDVDQIIALKNNGVSAEFITGMRQSGWGKLPAKSLIDLRNNGVNATYAADMLDADINDLTIGQVIELHNHGVRSEWVQQVRASGFGKFDARELIDLQNNGVRAELLRALKDSGYAGVPAREIIAAQQANLTAAHLREARQFGSSLTLQQVIKLRHSGVLR